MQQFGFISTIVKILQPYEWAKMHEKNPVFCVCVCEMSHMCMSHMQCVILARPELEL